MSLRALTVFGTRPEAIKLAQVVRRLEATEGVEAQVCVTSQHREMLDQVLNLFGIEPQYDLNVIRPSQDLASITTAVIDKLTPILSRSRPDVLIVQGDTSTSFAAALAAFYQRIPVAHVEAGLRTGNLWSPWPEEANRRITSVLATWHFAPTERARKNLLFEGVAPSNVVVTGNTVIDTLLETHGMLAHDPRIARAIERGYDQIDFSKRIVLVTGHRRENFGPPLEAVCQALRDLAGRGDVEVVYPVHLNPNVQSPVRKLLGDTPGIHLLPPQDYLSFVFLMSRSHIIVTDSGGIQEEAPSLGKPVLVTRDTTERPEAVETGTVALVGTDRETIRREAARLLDDAGRYREMSRAQNPYGDGRASERIVDFLQRVAGRATERHVAALPVASRAASLVE